MSEAKPFASLSSGLLARKGQAKPAMRPGGFAGSVSHDDLGWNDMGYDRPAPPRFGQLEFRAETAPVAAQPAPVVQAPVVQPIVQNTPVAEVAPVPQVLRQQAEIAEEFGGKAQAVETPPVAAAKPVEAETVEAPLVVAPTPAPRRVARKAPAAVAVPARGKAAFTLRLDPERHLRLRLACTVRNRSAQVIVTEALDALLAQHPELDALAASIPGRPA